MGVIDPASALASAVTPRQDLSAPNASAPTCSGLPATDTTPADLSRPTGGLIGNVSYINVNEGTDYSVDAVALSQWSDKVQWSAPGNAHPNLADVSPMISYVVDAREDGDTAYISNWSSGRDAVTALFMVNQVRNDITVEPGIKAATDWVMTMPTKRFYVNATRADLPFLGGNMASDRSDRYVCEVRAAVSQCYFDYFDREGQVPGVCIIFYANSPGTATFCGAASVQTFTANGGSASLSNVFQSKSGNNVGLQSGLINGWYDFFSSSIGPSQGIPTEVSRLAGIAGGTNIINTVTGQVTVGATVTYYGLPIAGFAAQSYGTTGLPGVSPNVLSNYGGQFNHKISRKIVVQQ
jgi:hypothetical protein